MRVRLVVLFFLALGIAALAGAPTPAAGDNVRDQAVVNFAHPILVGTEWVSGRAVVVHDDDASARGELCTFIYRQDTQTGKTKLVQGYKCERVERSTADKFTLVTRLDSIGNRVLSGVQFRGQAFEHEFVRDNRAHVHGGN